MFNALKKCGKFFFFGNKTLQLSMAGRVINSVTGKSACIASPYCISIGINFHCTNSKFQASWLTGDVLPKYLACQAREYEFVPFFRILKLIFLFNGPEPGRSNSQFDLLHYSAFLWIRPHLYAERCTVALSLPFALTSHRTQGNLISFFGNENLLTSLASVP
jgi:hypothetical protein